MKYVRMMGLLWCTLVPTVSLAQAEKVLRAEEINERALVDLLAPAPGPDEIALDQCHSR
jgi:hypothetical protein